MDPALNLLKLVIQHWILFVFFKYQWVRLSHNSFVGGLWVACTDLWMFCAVLLSMTRSEDGSNHLSNFTCTFIFSNVIYTWLLFYFSDIMTLWQMLFVCRKLDFGGSPAGTETLCVLKHLPLCWRNGGLLGEQRRGSAFIWPKRVCLNSLYWFMSRQKHGTEHSNPVGSCASRSVLNLISAVQSTFWHKCKHSFLNYNQIKWHQNQKKIYC